MTDSGLRCQKCKGCVELTYTNKKFCRNCYEYLEDRDIITPNLLFLRK